MNKKLVYSLLALLVCLHTVGYCTTYFNKSSGVASLQTLSNWGINSDGTGTAPGSFTSAGDVFNLVNGSTGTISAAWVITGVTLNVGNGSAMNLTIPSTFSLTGTGTVAVAAGGTLTLQNTTNPTLGTLNATSTVNYNGTGAQTVAAATYGNLTISGTRSGTPAITFTGTTNVKSVFSITESGAVTYTTTGNTFVYGATAGGQTILSVIPYVTLTLSNTSGTNTVDGNIAVSGVLTTTAGGTLDMGTFTLSETGAPVNNGTIKTQNTSATPITTGKAWGGTINYNAATGGQTVVSETSYATLTLGNTSGTQTAAAATVVNTALNTTNGGTFDMSTFALSGTLTTITNNGTILTQNISAATVTSGKTWGGSGVINYNAATGGQKIMLGTYNCDLTLSNTSGTQTASGVLTINGNFTITSGGTLNMVTFAIAGTPASVSNAATITTQSLTNPAIPPGFNWGGNLTYNATTGAQFIPLGTYNNLTFGNTSGTETATGALTVNGALTTTSAGILAMGANQLLGTLATLTHNGAITTTCTANPAIPTGQTWSGTTGTVTFSATTGGQFIPAGTYKTLICSNTSNTNTVVGDITVNTGLTTSAAGGTLDMGTNMLSGAFTPTNTGTLKTQNTSSTPIPSGKTWAGTVNYNAATGGQTIVSETSYATLTLGNTSGTQTASAALTVNTALNTTSGGTFDMTTFALAGTLTTITNNGTILTQNISTVPVTSGKIWGGTGVINYNATTGGQKIMLGTYNCDLILSNTSGTNTASGVLTINGNFTTTSGGILNMVSFAIAGSPASVNDSTTIQTQSVTNPPLPAGYIWGGPMVFNRANGGQSIPLGTYNDLSFSNTSGTQTARGNVTVNGNFVTTSNGVLAMGAFQLAGTPLSVTNNGSITTSDIDSPAIPPGQDWTGTQGKVTFGSLTGGQYIPAGTYKTLLCSNTSNTNMAAGDIAVTTALTTSAAGGTLDMGTYVLTGAFTPTNTGMIETRNTSSTPIPSGKIWAGTVNYYSDTGGQTIVSETSYATLTLSNTTGTQTAAANLTVNTALNTTTGGTLDMTTFALAGTLTTITNNGTILTQNTSAAPVTTTKTWGGTGVINYNAAAGGQTIMRGTYNCDLVLNNTSGTNTASNVLTINGGFTTTAGGTLNMVTFAIAGSPTFVNNNGIIQTQSITNPGLPPGLTWGGQLIFNNATGGQDMPLGTYNDLIFLNTSGTQTARGNLTVNGSFTTTAGGTIAMGTNQLGGTPASITNNGAITTSDIDSPAIPAGHDWTGTVGSVTFGATTGGQFVPAGTYQTLIFSNSSNNNTVVGNLIVTTAFNISSSGGTVDMGAYTLSGAFTPNNSGTLLTQNTGSAPIPPGNDWAGTVNYNADAGGQTIVPETSYKNLTLSNTSGTNTAGGDLVVNIGLNTTAGGTFDMTTFALGGTLNSITNNGILLTQNTSAAPLASGNTWGGTGPVVYNAVTGGQTIVKGTYNGGLTNSNTSGTNTIESAGVVSTSDLTLSANSSLNDNGVTIIITGNILGTGTHTGTGKISMTSSGATISGVTLGNLTLNNAGGFSLSGDATINNTLTFTAGKLAIANNTLIINGSITGISATNSITGSAGTSNLTIGGSGALGTIYFDQTTDGTTNNIATLTLNRSSAGTVTLGNILNISTGLILSNGILTDGGNAIKIKGDWTNNSSTNAFSSTGTVTFSKTGTQTIGGSSGTNFNNLSIGSGSATTMNTAGQTLSGILFCDNTLNANGNLTLLSTASQTALIDGSGAGDVLGNVIMQCYLSSGFGYKYVSSPFSGSTVNDLSGYINLSDTFPTFYDYDESLASSGWVIYTTSSNSLSPLKGYAGNFGPSLSPETISLTGSVNNGTVSTTLFNHNNTYTLGFNLAGNPYPSPIDWDASSGWTKTNIDDAVYYFNASDTNVYTGSYSSYVGGVSSDGVANNIIPAMQGFFVHVSNGAYPVTGSLSVNNNARINNLSHVFHKPARTSGRPLVRINTSFSNSNASADPTVVYFDDNATAVFNKELDAIKLMNTDDAIPNLYTTSADAINLSIHALSFLVDSVRIVPLGLQIEKSGTINFNAQDIDNMPYGIHIYLYDAQTGLKQDLANDPKYTVVLDKGKYENRFSLVLSFKDNIYVPASGNELNAYSSNGKLYVYVLSKGNLIVTNMLGQVIDKEELNGNGFHEINLNNSSGMYIATLYSETGRQSKKIFIGNQ